MRTASGSRADFDRTSERAHLLDRVLRTQREAAHGLMDLATRELAKATGPAISVSDLERGRAVPVGTAATRD